MAIVGLVNPGEMGASVGAAVAGRGHRVLWASIGRSEATRRRAKRGGLIDCGTLSKLVSGAEFIMSVCPPHSAQDVAEAVAGLGFDGVYLDANAIAPNKSRRIEKIVSANGAIYVDGSITGGPAWEPSAGTILHLSGPFASAIAELFAGSPLTTRLVSDTIGAASALKMAFAANTKGTNALLTAVLGLAEQEGVRADLERLWGETFTEKTRQRVTATTAKAWRFVGEMEEIAATFSGAGLPDGFHLAAADTYSRLASFKDRDQPPPIEEVLEALLVPSNQHH